MTIRRFWAGAAAFGAVGLAVLVTTAVRPSYGQTVVVRQPDRQLLVDDGVRAEVFLDGPGHMLGAAVRDVDTADASREKLASPRGAVIEEVRTGSPAADSGLKAGDVVVTFDGETVRSARHLTRLVRESPAGVSVPLTVARGGARVDMEVTLGDRQGTAVGDRIREWLPRWEWFEDMAEPPLLDAEISRARGGRLGVSVQRLSGQLARYFGVESGVLVSGVSEGSAAATAGLKAGDVIVTVDGRAIDSVGALREAIARVGPDATASIEIVRDKQRQTVSATLPESTNRRVTRRLISRSRE